jgi:hypothetical protein
VIRIPISYSRAWRWLLTICLLPRAAAYIHVTGDDVKISMGWAFRTTFSRLDVIEVVDQRSVMSVGVHGWRGRWLVNGANSPIAAIRLSRPVRARVLGIATNVREILVSVDDRDALRRALIH